MRTALPLAAALAATVLLPAQRDVHPEELKLKPDIDKAIAKGVKHLIDTQYRDGTWGQWGHYRGGKTALVTYALLKSGVDVDHPAVQRAFLYLDDVIPAETYTLGCMMLCYAAAGRVTLGERLEEWTGLLLDWQRTGDWAYPGGNADLSNTQYAALGMWVAQKHGIEVPRKAWTDLAAATLRYAEKATRVEVETTGKGTVQNGGMVEIAGFGYRKGQKATGSMTTAGISTLAICKIGLGSRAGKLRREADRAIDAGIEWLGHHFSVEKNPNKGDWHYYYLYGMERTGSLTRRERFGSHWWYIEGARELLKKQNKDQGHWGGDAQKKAVRAAFALLFLRRATAQEAATTGEGQATDVVSHIFEGGSEKDDVTVGGAGQQPLAVWVPGFGKELQKKHEKFGLRVVKVEYYEGDDVLGQVAGDPTKAWQSDAYLYRVPALARGEHEIHARVELLAPDAMPGEDDVEVETEELRSPPMKVVIRDVFAPWMAQAARAAKSNLVALAEPVAEASSTGKTAKHACDGKENSHWVCSKDDKAPRISVRLGDSVRASQLLLSQAGSCATDIGIYDRITAIEVAINRGTPIRVEMDPDQLAVTSIPFEKKRRVRQIEIRILDRVPGKRAGQAGFTEIALIE